MPQFRFSFGDDFLSDAVCLRKRRNQFRDLFFANRNSLALHFRHAHTVLNSLERTIDGIGCPWFSAAVQKQKSARSVGDQPLHDRDGLVTEVDNPRGLLAFSLGSWQNSALIR